MIPDINTNFFILAVPRLLVKDFSILAAENVSLFLRFHQIIDTHIVVLLECMYMHAPCSPPTPRPFHLK